MAPAVETLLKMILGHEVAHVARGHWNLRMKELVYTLRTVYLKISRAAFALFPPFKVLANQYPYLRSKPILLPGAWIQYVVYRVKQAVQRKFLTRGLTKNENSFSDAGAERIELFKKFGMM